MPDHIESYRDDPFPELTTVGDPALRLVAWLIRNKDFRQLEQRTGIRDLGSAGSGTPTNPKYQLPVLIHLDTGPGTLHLTDKLHKVYGVPLAYQDATKRNDVLRHVAGRLPLGDEIFQGSVTALVDGVKELGDLGAVRVSLGALGQPSLQRASRGDVGLPPARDYNGHALSGEGVVVGIIDDGCAFAHNDFLKPRLAGAAAASRILYLWDQGGSNLSGGWVATPGFYGRELDQAAIDTALNANMAAGLIAEDRVYRSLGYGIGEVAPHGTHVMDIAAGTGQSLMGVEGIAPGADIIFVQLPAAAILQGAGALAKYIADGALYVFERAKALGKPAVVNISYGGYEGPHDGTSELERTLDELLAEADRAIVIAAGNGFEARCHARTDVPRKGTASLRWIVRPEDPTGNSLEAWYGDTSKLCVRLRSPGAAIDPGGWIQLGQSTTPITRSSDGKTIGYVEHLASGTGNGANRIVISLNATDAAAGSGTSAPATNGMWSVDFKHDSGKAAEVHAWIWRDDSGHPAEARRRQSRFHPDDADPAHTIAGWATGSKTISVGAYNSATQEICRYSACGPTRPTAADPGGRAKPEVYAPAEEDARGRGVLSASALSARPTRMNGTSVSAPHITGLIALIFEYARKHAVNRPVALTAEQIAQQLKAASNVAPSLKLNRHQAVNARVKKKQKDVRNHLCVSGKADFTETMKKLPL